MKIFRLYTIFLFLLIFANKIYAEILIPNEEDKNSLIVYLIQNPLIKDNPVIIRDIDNNLTISKTNTNILDGKIELDACLLTDLDQIGKSDFRSYNDPKDIQYYEVTTMYESYGISNITTILANKTETELLSWATSLGFDLEIDTKCKFRKTGNPSYAYARLSEKDLFFIPNYLYTLLLENSKFLKSIANEDVLGSWTFDEMISLSKNYLVILAEEEKLANQFMNKFTSLAEEKNKKFMSSLYLNMNSYQSQKFCTLSYSDEDAVSAIGYRLLGDEMVIDEKLKRYYKLREVTLNYKENENYFENVFDNISEAFTNIKTNLNNNVEDYCNVFIDYPENLLKLKIAIERDLDRKTILGGLFDKSITSNKYAMGQGFDNYNQLLFANLINADYEIIKSLENYKIFNQSDLKKVQNEMININYSDDISTNNVITYLDDLSGAKQQNINVIDFKNARVKEEERLAKEMELIRQKARAEFIKEFPYTAILTCGLGGNDHINIVACFSGGSSGVDTTLEIMNGQNYQMYKPFNINQAGKQYSEGLEINLKDSFSLFAQNSSRNLILSLEIIDNETGMSLYKDSASQYEVVTYNKY